MTGKCIQEFFILLCKWEVVLFIYDLNYSDYLFLRIKRDTQDRPCLESCFSVHRLIESRLIFYIIDNNRFSGLCYPACNPLPYLELYLFYFFTLFTECNSKNKFLFIFIKEKDRAYLSLHDLCCIINHYI